MDKIFCVAFVDNSMQDLHEEREPVEMQRAQNVAKENHEPADRFVRSKPRWESVERVSRISELLNNDKPSPEPGHNQ